MRICSIQPSSRAGFATAGIFDLLEGLVGLLDRGHPFHQGKPDPRGAARDSP